MEGIIIRAKHLEEVIGHCREAFPKEACGILAGIGDAVEMVIRLRNADDSPVTYSLDPAEQNRALRFIDSEGLRVVAIYHSHTASAAYPSPTDVERAFFPGTKEPNFPDSAYVIVSLAGEKPSVRAFMIRENAIEETEITVA